MPAGAAVTVEYLDGSTQRGELITVSTPQKRIVVDSANADNAIEIDFAKIRSVFFEHDPGDDLAATSSDEPTAYRIKFKDGRSRHGRCRGFAQNAAGLHISNLCHDGRARRIFVPEVSLAKFRTETLEMTGPAPVDVSAPQACADQGSVSVVRAAELRTLLAARDPYASSLPNAAQPAPEPPPPPIEHARALATRLDVPLVDLRHFDIESEALAALPAGFVSEHLVLPLMLHDDHLVVAMENPADVELIRLAQFLAGKRVETCVASHHDLVFAVGHHYGEVEGSTALEELESVASTPEFKQDSNEDLEKLGQEKPIVRLVHSMITNAVRRRVSDIHIRPGESDVELLYREDGTLVAVRRFSKALLAAVVARIKILGRMNVAERRLPQDGRARIAENAAQIDLRISVIPTVNGESVVIRLLNAGKVLGSIAELGFTPQDQARYVDLLHRSYGIVLVTGPTGSGKSMTLFASLQEILKQNVNVITVEDPVEYRLNGVEQIQVNTVPGFTFARALRNILRHDPDVIMIGEIRDQETAKIAVESALTGHLVLSTLHTNDAPTAVTRLIEMGVDAFLVRASVLGALAQRLVRLNCPHCLAEEPVDPMQRALLAVPLEEVFYRGAGCDECNGTGFKGRRAVLELLVMTPALRDIIAADTPSDRIRRAALDGGMQPLTQNALALARERKISLAEVYRVRLE
ncbi:MAG: GspE/PulE family protein [Thiotrichales bacterium]